MSGWSRGAAVVALATIVLSACAPASTPHDAPLPLAASAGTAGAVDAPMPPNQPAPGESPRAPEAGLPQDVSDLTGRWPGAQTRSGESVTVVGEASPEVMRLVVAAGDEAWRRCRATWPESVPPGVLVLPADEAQSRAVARDGVFVPPASLPREVVALTGAAATTIVVGSPPGARARVHLASAAPAALTDEGLRVVLTHECVHVALATRERPDAPRWLVEGVAEHVAYESSTVDRALVLAPFLDDLAQRGAAPEFPSDTAFEMGSVADASTRRHDQSQPALRSETSQQASPPPTSPPQPHTTQAVTRAYAAALSAADSYARHQGKEALVRLVTQGTPDGHRDRAGYAAVEARHLPVWRRDLDQARGQL